MNRKQNSNSDGALAIFIVLIAIVLMPIAGIYLLTKDSTKEKVIGIVLTIVGIMLWIALFAAKT